MSADACREWCWTLIAGISVVGASRCRPINSEASNASAKIEIAWTLTTESQSSTGYPRLSRMTSRKHYASKWRPRSHGWRLAENGYRLATHHQLEGDAGGLGFAIASEMAAELGEGAAKLFNEGLWYPGAALVRQLIEFVYLLTLMGQQRIEAEQWMASTREQIMSTFMPRQMRKRSVRNFRLGEYQSHCDWGGHPNPAGRPLLRHHDEWRQAAPRAYWLDLAQHQAEIWESFCVALPLYDPRLDETHDLYAPHRSPDGADEVTPLLARWREQDRLARGLPPEAFYAPS